MDCNLIQAFDRCMAFIRKHTIDPFFLIDDSNVSVRDKIAKELVSNILVHREFSSPRPARIVIERDRIVADNWNRSQHSRHLTPDSFEPLPKNPILARFFVNIGYADTLGSGVRNLFKYSKMYSGADPEMIEGDVFKTIIPLPQIRGEAGAVSDTEVSAEVKDGTNFGTKDGTNFGTKLDRETGLKLTQREILDVIATNPSATAQEIADSVGKTKRWTEAVISTLRKEGLLKRVGPNKGGHWEIVE